MALNFPSSPNVGDQYTSGGVIWVWDGAKWTAGGISEAYLPLVGGTMTGPITLPGDPATALQASTKQYVDAINPAGKYLPLGGGTITGALVVNSAAAVLGGLCSTLAGAPPLALQSPPTNDSSNAMPTTSWVNAAINAAVNRQNRNRLINGNFLFDQYNNYVAITPAANGNICDRWTLGLTQPSKLTVNSVASTAGLPFYRTLRAATAAAYTPLATDAFYMYQGFEYLNIADFQNGSVTPQPMTLSFWAYASVAGTYSGSLQGNLASGGPTTYRSYPFTFTLAANTWTYITITIPGDTSVWTAPTLVTGLGMYLFFDLGSGANFRAPAGAWVSGNILGANGSTNLVATAGAALLFANVQLELGSQATPFDFRPAGEELMLCQRYYQTLATLIASGYNSAGGIVYNSFVFPVAMRAVPTVTYGNPAPTYNNASALSSNVNYNSGIMTRITITAAGQGYATFGITARAEL